MIYLLFFTLNAHADTSRGVVYEKGINIPVPEASVVIIPQKIRTLTNAKGEFFITDPQSNFEDSKIIIQKLGYEKYESDLKNKSANVAF